VSGDAGPRPQLLALHLDADPAAWRAMGFDVVNGRVRIGTSDVVLSGDAGAEGAGLTGWTLAGAIPQDDGLEGIPTTIAAAPHGEAPPIPHANGVTAIDHVVLATPDTARTCSALEAAGFALRRVRDAGTPERPLRQGFFLFSDVLLEVVGPPEPAPGTGDGPAALWGITLVADDLTAAAASFGPHLSAPRDAVQAGRQIATVDRAAGLGVRVALMSPR
jgi:hypothetical protein